MWDPLSEFNHAVFPNGLELHSAYWPNRPWQKVFFVIHGGSDADPFGAEGTAHFLEHLISESSGFGRKEIEKKFDSFGGSVCLGRTGFNSTIYNFFGPTDRIFMLSSFNLFGRMLFENALDYDMEKNRRVIMSEFNYHFEMEHNYHLALMEKQRLYPNYFRSRATSPLGLRETVEEMTIETIKSFYERTYVPKNISLVSVGGLKIYELMDLIFQSELAQEKAGKRYPTKNSLNDFEKLENNFYLFNFSEYYKTAAEDFMGSGSYRSVARIPGKTRRWTVAFLRDMIGQIIHQEVRENKSWTYSMSTRSYYFGDVQELVVECPSLSLNAIDEIEATVTHCFDQVEKNGDLFEQLRRRLLQRLDLIDVSGVDLCKQAAENMAEIRRIPTFHEWEKEIKSITLEEIVALTRWIVPEMRWTVLKRP